MFRRSLSVAPLVFALSSVCSSGCLEKSEAPRPVAEVVQTDNKSAPIEEDRRYKRELLVPAAFDGKYDPILDAENAGDPSNNTEEYDDHGINPFVLTARDPLSTFAIDVDTGSYTIARRKLNEGMIPPKESVRVEEFVNYFRYDYGEPADGPFAVHLEAAPSPFVADADTHLVRVGLQGKRVDTKTRKPVHLTFLVDVSGSMNRPDKLGLAQKSLETLPNNLGLAQNRLEILTNNLGPEDTVAIATYAGRVAEVLPPTGMHERGKILSALGSLRAGGSTAMNSGLEIAYRLALKTYESDHVNRVVVLSDGDANIGPSSHDEILERIQQYVDQGVTLSTIGFGMGNYKDNLMEQLANRGNGNYYYVDTIDEARRIFGEQLDGTLQVIAKDVKIQVEFNPEAIERYRLIGYENRAIADEDFRDDTVDAGEIGAGHTVTAMYEVEMKPDPPTKLAEVRIRHMEPQGDSASESVYRWNRAEVRRQVSDASADFAFAAAVTAFAEILRHSPYADHLDYDLVHEIALGATGEQQTDRAEFVQLVERARALSKRE